MLGVNVDIIRLSILGLLDRIKAVNFVSFLPQTAPRLLTLGRTANDNVEECDDTVKHCLVARPKN